MAPAGWYCDNSGVYCDIICIWGNKKTGRHKARRYNLMFMKNRKPLTDDSCPLHCFRLTCLLFRKKTTITCHRLSALLFY
jgi:hypothetical protein